MGGSGGRDGCPVSVRCVLPSCLPAALLTRPLNCRLVAAYPRTVYSRGGDKLHTLGLGSQAALLIEAISDE